MSINTAALWTLRLDRTVQRQLDRLPNHDSDAIRAALKALARDPFGHSKAERLDEYGFGWRLRVRYKTQREGRRGDPNSGPAD